MADEWLDIAGKLWESWADDAVLIDEDADRYVDFTKVHPINYRGRFFSSRGPLNTIPGPQRRPVIAQAGSSPQGQALAGKYADTMLALVSSVDEMKRFRGNVHAAMLSAGRKPQECKILYLVSPTIAETDADARELATGIGRTRHGFRDRLGADRVLLVPPPPRRRSRPDLPAARRDLPGGRPPAPYVGDADKASVPVHPGLQGDPKDQSERVHSSRPGAVRLPRGRPRWTQPPL
jgi:alkanesulfonate monooxygenase SsuD/methylene tetrahydromethanopterin reductase-like flavin-dependent oxidoreductase (luciferase family)